MFLCYVLSFGSSNLNCEFIHREYDSFFNKVAGACNFIKKEALTQVFSCKFCEIFKNIFLKRKPPVAASEFLRNFLVYESTT